MLICQLDFLFFSFICTFIFIFLYRISRPERYSYDLIKKSGEFVINLTNEKLAFATDWCGVRSGKDYDNLFVRIKMLRLRNLSEE